MVIDYHRACAAYHVVVGCVFSIVEPSHYVQLADEVATIKENTVTIKRVYTTCNVPRTYFCDMRRTVAN